MLNYRVIHQDAYGDTQFDTFDTIKEVCDLIEEKMKSDELDLTEFTVIRGELCGLTEKIAKTAYLTN